LTKSGTDKETVYVEKAQPNSSSTDSNNDSTFANDTNNLLPNAKNNSNHTIENVYCVSYIDGTQRVIVFTTDHSLADIERRKECSSMEIFLSLKGMQVSVINNVNLEIATISIKDSRPLWSVVSGNETKMFSNEYSNRIEKHYCDYLVAANKSFADARRSHSLLQTSRDLGVTFDFNFDTMSIESPEKGQLKRVWRPGLSVQYRSSRNMNSFICCIHKVQIDNQLPDAYFPISLYKAPLNLKDLDKLSIPFMTMSFFTEQQEVTQIYRYIDCVLQEFYLKVDKGFILSLKDWYDAASTSTNDIRFVLDDEEVQEGDACGDSQDGP
jgi:vacuolar protein sorting-associated protein 13A/C